MKSVLISIQPKWCELIASGKKTVEVRKTKPKLETPFKCYIYCTNKKKGDNEWRFKPYLYLDKSSQYGEPKVRWIDVAFESIFKCEYLHGKVIGEFVCNKIDKIFQCNSGWVKEHACISREEYFEYLGLPYNSHFDDKGAYAWHISALVIYDKPRELGGFYHACKQPSGTDCSVCRDRVEQNCWQITRPPQSWCYVESEELVEVTSFWFE